MWSLDWVLIWTKTQKKKPLEKFGYYVKELVLILLICVIIAIIFPIFLFRFYFVKKKITHQKF